MIPGTTPTTEIQRRAEIDSEEACFREALESLSSCNWTIGRCACEWTQRWARGRTDAEFGVRVGLSSDQVCQRRLVWERFADVRGQYQRLSWSHFYAALNWDDSAECLQWAEDLGATVAEMKAWRRSQHGEDLTQPPDDEGDVEDREADSRAPERANGNGSATGDSSAGPSTDEAREPVGDAPARTRREARPQPENNDTVSEAPPPPTIDTEHGTSIDQYVMQLRDLGRAYERDYPGDLAEFADECRTIAQRFDPSTAKGKGLIVRFDPKTMPLPDSLDDDQFRAAWNDFHDWRRAELKKPYKEQGARQLLKKLESYPPAVGATAMRNAMAAGHMAVLPENVKLQGQQSFAQREADNRSEDRGQSLQDWLRSDEEGGAE